LLFDGERDAVRRPHSSAICLSLSDERTREQVEVFLWLIDRFCLDRSALVVACGVSLEWLVSRVDFLFGLGEGLAGQLGESLLEPGLRIVDFLVELVNLCLGFVRH